MFQYYNGLGMWKEWVSTVYGQKGVDGGSKWRPGMRETEVRLWRTQSVWPLDGGYVKKAMIRIYIVADHKQV